MLSNYKFILLLIIAPLFACDHSGSDLLKEEENQKATVVRKFLFEALSAPSGEALRKVCETNVDAVYLLVNDEGLLERLKFPTGVQDAIARMLDPKLVGRTTKQLKTVFADYVPLDEYNTYQKELAKTIEEYDLSEVTAQLQKIEVPKLGKDWTKFFKGILTDYFKNLSHEDKTRMFAYMVGHAKAGASHAEYAEQAIYAAGPYFQKFIQLVSNKLDAGGDPELINLKKKLENVKSHLPPIAPVEIDNYLAELRKQDVDIKIGAFIAAASLGAVYHATYKNKPIVIKFMRPGIEEIAAREKKIFIDVASFSPAMKKSVEEIAKQIDEELDFREEAEKLKAGAKIYNDPNQPIHVATLIEGFPVDRHWMAMDLAPGKSFDQLRGRLPPNELLSDKDSAIQMFSKAILLNILTREIIHKAFFPEKGQPAFFHGDLHEGNMMIYIDDTVYSKFDKIEDVTEASVKKVMKEKDKNGNFLIRLTVLDFGNAHFLTKRESNGLLNMLIAAGEISDSPTAFLDAFSELANDPSIKNNFDLWLDLDSEVYTSRLNPFGEGPSRTFDKTLGAAFDVMMKNDIPIPGKAMAFLRTIGMLVHDYDSLKEEAKKMDYCFDNLSSTQAITSPIGRRLGDLHVYNFAPESPLNSANFRGVLTTGVPYVLKWALGEQEWSAATDLNLKTCKVTWQPSSKNELNGIEYFMMNP